MKRNFFIQDLGSITVITPKTKKAKKWMENNLVFESWQLIGDGVGIDFRCAKLIIEAIEIDF